MTFVAGGEHDDHRASVPGPTVSSGRCHCQNNEDQENTNPQPPDLRTV